MTKRQAAVYPIGTVEKLTGLTARRIRYYEQMGLLAPERSAGRQRLYSQEDVDRLLTIKSLLAQGVNLKGIRSMLEGEKEGHPSPGRNGTVRYPASRTWLQPHTLVSRHRLAGEAGGAGPEATLAARRENISEPEQRLIRRPLDSLYPVRNQARLQAWLVERSQMRRGREDEED
ncbi:MAG: MerR family transcriptional regulator [Firmicutes bacterium]|nr:MerR family transcriptional regulator [Bacillota bacterium]